MSTTAKPVLICIQQQYYTRCQIKQAQSRDTTPPTHTHTRDAQRTSIHNYNTTQPTYPSTASFLTTPNIGTTLSLTPCTLSINPPSPATLGDPSTGVLLGHAHSASKSICSSAPLSSEYRLGTRVASKPDRSSTLDKLGGRDGASMVYGSLPDMVAEGTLIGERCTERFGGAEG